MPALHVIVCLAALAGAEPYDWPLDPPRILTSSFAEYRGGRFHAGVDLRAEVGQPVYAPGDGYVARVRCSPWGYGKVIYLQLADGNLMVFAHLSNFEPGLAAAIRRAQHAGKNYTAELTPSPSEFPFKRGERIAFTGRTGTVDPHLHFEPRDPQNRPVSLRTLGMEWPDTTAPLVNKVLIVPKNPASRVNGDILPAICNVRLVDGTHYVCDPVRVSGEIGIGVDLVDPSNNGENKLCIHTVRTLLGKDEVFIMRMDRFSYDDRQDEIVSYYPFLADKGHFLLQWRWPGNDCEIYQQTKSEGWLAMPQHAAEATLDIKDFYDNEATVSIPLEPEAPTAPTETTAGDKGTGSVDVECVDEWLAVTAKFTAPESVAPELSAEGAEDAPGDGALTFHRVDDRTFRVGVAPASAAREIVLRVTHPRIDSFEQRVCVFHRGAKPRTVDAAGVSIAVESDSPYGTLFLRAYPAKQVSTAPIPMRSNPLRLWPAAMPIDVPLHVTFPMPASVEKPARAGVYRDNGDHWTLEDAKQTAAGFELATSRLGAFAIFEDTRAPEIADIVVEPTPGTPRRPAIHAKITDVGSGIADASITVDGHWLLAGYDPERDALVWDRDEDLPEGAKSLLFTVTDRAGNTTSKTRTLTAKAESPDAKRKAKPQVAAPEKKTAKPTKK